MSTPTVRRWVDEAGTSSELRSLLEGCDAVGPSERDLQRFAARMAPLVGLPLSELSPLVPTGTAPLEVSELSGAGLSAGSQAGLSAKSLWGTALGKLGMSAAVSLLVGGALWWGTASLESPGQARPATVPSAALSATLSAKSPVTRESAPSGVTPVVEPNVASEGEAPTVVPRGVRRHAEAPPDELSLMAEAQALRGKNAALLRVLARHAKFYPNGMLAQEREVLMVEAWLQSGNLKQAQKHAATLEARFPSSAHLPRIRHLLEKAAEE